VIFIRHRRGRSVDEVRTGEGGALRGGPAVVLVNEFGASASEVEGALEPRTRSPSASAIEPNSRTSRACSRRSTNSPPHHGAAGPEPGPGMLGGPPYAAAGAPGSGFERALGAGWDAGTFGSAGAVTLGSGCPSGASTAPWPGSETDAAGAASLASEGERGGFSGASADS
jgi:hypothetical protein